LALELEAQEMLGQLPTIEVFAHVHADRGSSERLGPGPGRSARGCLKAPLLELHPGQRLRSGGYRRLSEKRIGKIS